MPGAYLIVYQDLFGLLYLGVAPGFLLKDTLTDS